MAGKVVKDLSEDFLSCCICMNQFKTPKMLPCIHSFCEECIEKYAAKQDGNEIPCPTCRKVCTLPEAGVKGLQTNFHLINLAEKVNLLEKLTSKEKRASVCDSCKNPEVVAFCVDCNFVICSKCKSHHALFPILQSHSVIPLKQINDPKFQQEWKTARSPFCALHTSEKLQFYCKTCSKLICRDCTIVLHSKPQHEYTEATSQFNDSKQELNSLLENSVPQLEKAVGYKRDGNVGVVALNKSKEEIDIEITNHCNEMIKEIRKVYEKQKQDLLEEITARIEPVESQVQSADDWIKRMQTTQEITRKIIRENNPWELMSLSSDLTNAFETLRVDSLAFQWSKSQLQHEILFSPGEVPDIHIGFQYRPCEVAVCDEANVIYLCTFEERNKYLYITKVTINPRKVEQNTPYKWNNEVSDGARLAVAIMGQQRQRMFIGLGTYFVEFNCASLHPVHNYGSRTKHVITDIACNSSSTLSIITKEPLKGDENMYCNAHINVFSSQSSGQLQASQTLDFSADSLVDSIFACYRDLFYTLDGELRAYHYYLVQQTRKNPGDTLYDVDPPKGLLNITQTDILHCRRIGTYPNKYNGQYHSDDANVFIVWKGSMIKAGKNAEETAWILKEYNTKDRKVLGDLKYVTGNAPRAPSALHCTQTGNLGMEIHLCDDHGNITTYRREPYQQEVGVVPYEVV
ncbi:uncharacterized protein [Apostichopus japonicus]|uniref:uncharacterized protein isoform X1 n=1 Tax=Stichopus japonicus TaxID=307972 RepID=UPI003AB16916